MQRFTPLLIDAARPCRHVVGDRWFVDETYVKVAGDVEPLEEIDQFVQVDQEKLLLFCSEISQKKICALWTESERKKTLVFRFSLISVDLRHWLNKSQQCSIFIGLFLVRLEYTMEGDAVLAANASLPSRPAVDLLACKVRFVSS